MEKKIQINVVGKANKRKVMQYNDLIECRFCVDGRVCTFWTTEANYEALVYDGFFLRNDKLIDQDGITNNLACNSGNNPSNELDYSELQEPVTQPVTQPITQAAITNLFSPFIDEIVDRVSERILSETADKEPKFYTRKETAGLLHVTLPTLARLTKDGFITSKRVGGRILYQAEAINEAVITNVYKKEL